MLPPIDTPQGAVIASRNVLRGGFTGEMATKKSQAAGKARPSGRKAKHERKPAVADKEDLI